MPLKTAEKKLIFPALCIIIAFAVLTLMWSPAESTELFPVSHGGDICLPLGDGFAAVNSSGISGYSKEGELLFSEERSLDTQLCASDGDRLAVVSQKTVCIYGETGLVAETECQNDVLALDIRGEYLAVSEKDGFFRGAVSFFEGEEKLFTRFLASSQCRDVLLAEDFACLLLEDELLFMRSPENTAVSAAEGAEKLHETAEGVCAESENALSFFNAKGVKTGQYEGAFTLVQSFGGKVCAQTDKGAAVLDTKGELQQILREGRALKFGSGDVPALIMGENTSVFDEKMEFLCSFENKYIPFNVITNKGAVILLWQSAAQVHRK